MFLNRIQSRLQMVKPLKLKLKLKAILLFAAWLLVAYAAADGAQAQSRGQAVTKRNPAAEQLKRVQGAEQSKGAVSQSAEPSEAWRHKPPVLPPPKAFKLPDVVSYRLPNGLTVQLVEDHRVPFITASLGLKAGSSDEPRELLGLAGLTADMLQEGTAKKTSKEIATEVDFIGGALSGASDYDNSLVSCSALSKYYDRLIDVLSDVVLRPSFPENELQLKKTNLIQELAIKRSEPDFLLEERFARVTFGDHPYSIVAPSKETVERITRKDLERFHAAHYLPNEAYLVIVGDFDANKMKDLIASKFGSDWRAGQMPVAEQSRVPVQHGQKIYLVDRPGSVQSSIKLGNVSIKKTDPDYFPMVIANQILGGAGSARLFLNIREQKGYTYGAYSQVGARKQPGAFAAEAEVRTEVTAPSLEEFLYELTRLRNLKVSDKELADAKSYLSGAFQLGLETQSGLSQRLLEEKLYDLPDNYLETYVSNLLAVTADDVRRVARKHIDLDNIVICVVGDASKVKPELQFFAPVDVYDTSGELSKDSKAEKNPGS
jgi:predicted Zn-dependent peptidase